MSSRLFYSIAVASAALAVTMPTPVDAQEMVTLAAGGQAQIFQAAGPNVASIQGTVDAFRNALGNLNANEPGSRGSGRREINWDGVPDEFSDPNLFPRDFFNANLSGRARGVVFSTKRNRFLVSTDSDNPTKTPVEFGRLNPTYLDQFATFSPERLFTALHSTVTVVKFFVPGEKTKALTTGFGAVFTDVDLKHKTKLEFFGKDGKLLHRQFVPNAPGKGTLSFAGVVFKNQVVSAVKITSGTTPLGPNDAPQTGHNVVVMDDFIYGEPVAR